MKTRGAFSLAALCVAACGQEVPTEVGGGLFPPDVIRSFEVVLEPSQYLVSDTSFGFYSAPPDGDFAVIANRWDGALDSRLLARYSIPTSITLPDSAGVTRTDSTPSFFEADIVLVLDSLRSSTRPVTLQLFRGTENWDQTATWTARVDTPGTRLPWTTPGGSPGQLVDSTTWATGDTVLLTVDSLTLATWRDTTNAGRGAVIAVRTQGARVRTIFPQLRVRVRTTVRRDTVVTMTLGPTQRTFIFQPTEPDSAANPRVGGTPAWRTFFRLRDRLDTVTVACPGTPGCRVRLGAVAINRAALLLQPVPVPRGLAPEGNLTFAAHLVLPTQSVPLPRSPITDVLSGEGTVPGTSFMTTGAPVVELAVTDLVLNSVAAPTDANSFRATWFALLPSGTRTFGFGAFAPLPSLRLVLTTTQGLQLP